MKFICAVLIFIERLQSKITLISCGRYLVQDTIYLIDNKLKFDELITVDVFDEKQNKSKKLYKVTPITKSKEDEYARFDVSYIIDSKDFKIEHAENDYRFVYRFRSDSVIMKIHEFINVIKTGKEIYSDTNNRTLDSLKRDFKFYIIHLYNLYKSAICKGMPVTETKKYLSEFYFVNIAIEKFITNIQNGTFDIDEVCQDFLLMFEMAYCVNKNIRDYGNVLKQLETSNHQIEVFNFMLSRLDKIEKVIMHKLKNYSSLKTKKHIMFPTSYNFKSEKVFKKVLIIEFTPNIASLSSHKFYFIDANYENINKNVNVFKHLDKSYIFIIDELVDLGIQYIVLTREAKKNAIINISDYL